jgi:RimJ/RimL family protein N-acetyltransferase
MEGNEPSIKLLEAVGFSLEGLCEKNLKVKGVWKTHRLYALLNPYEELG